jgi:hypothetical protein
LIDSWRHPNPGRARLLGGGAHGQNFPVIMKWFYAGLALSLGAFVAGLASIVLGYRQVIGNYIQDKQAAEGQKATAESARQPQANKRGLTRM